MDRQTGRRAEAENGSVQRSASVLLHARNAAMRPQKTAALLVVLALAACGGTNHGGTTPRIRVSDRARFNQLALRLDLPLFWTADTDGNGEPGPDEVRSLLFYGASGAPASVWVSDGHFTPAFDAAALRLRAEADVALPSDPRRALVMTELDHAAPTLVFTDLTGLPPAHHEFARHMLVVAGLVDRLYARQVGMEALSDRTDPEDTASMSLFRRNWGARCLASITETDPACSPIAGAPHQRVDVYPESVQGDDDSFCAALEALPNATALLSPFVVVREIAGELTAVPYTEVYAELMRPIAVELRAAADAMTDPAETALTAYLRAAATSFETNDWAPADEAWAAVATPEGLAAWLAPIVDLPAVEPGAAGRIVDYDDVAHVVAVRSVEVGRSVTFTWWRVAAPADASTVTISLKPALAGRTRLRVVETTAGMRAKASVASALARLPLMCARV